MDKTITAYRNTNILGKSQLELIIQVYDGAIEAFQAAREAYESDDNNAGFDQLQRAKRFVTHLYTTLDMEQGGEIADRLSRLYAFVINQTSVIEATKDLKHIDDNIIILSNLRSAWKELSEQEKGVKSESARAATEEGSVTTTA